jgi:hypothetical protein
MDNDDDDDDDDTDTRQLINSTNDVDGLICFVRCSI